MKEAKPTPNLPVFINAEDFLDSLPPGYCFKPRDDELIVHYLRRRVCNKPLPPNRIKEVELYKYSPDDLTQADNASSQKVSEWYFFTPRDRKYVNGSRPSRTAGDGFWKATGSDTSVMFKGNIVGFKKTLVYYYGKPPKGEKTNWIMHEYVLSNPPARQRAGKDDMRLDDWVLCRLHNRNDTKVGATQQATDQKQEEENYAIVAAQTEILEQQYDENILPLQIEIPVAQAEILEQQYGKILPPQTEQVQVQDFNLLLPQQTCSMPLYNPYDDSTSGFTSFPESLHPMLEYHSTMFPQQDVSVYGNIITTVAPIATIPPPQFQHSVGHDPLNMHQQQQFSSVPNIHDPLNMHQQQQQFPSAPNIHDPLNMYQQQQFSSVPNIHDPLNMHQQQQQQFSGAPNIHDPLNMHQQQQQFSRAPNIHDPLNMHQQQQFSGAPNFPDPSNMDQQQQQFSGGPNIHGPLNMHQQEQQFSDAPDITELLAADQYLLDMDHDE
ncbi:hypothetical protein QUC31_018074 [Theobroma cacao]